MNGVLVVCVKKTLGYHLKGAVSLQRTTLVYLREKK